ncbi:MULTISPECIES: GGDEF domain-containing protein [unclassified Oceanispirochaeta]|uniref:GGDEF domain-containing protein n=1 Tax=unclassified Oceanispirochaeta TaxID=2635722 RepID=UPI000E08F3F9|nr:MULTISPECIES: GGDEF domain-containing protein [unclassified Oceanispirochaeta]MBF9015592.1 GGDEF domain-containing protein [Oceanispirochaeta sp. M2]NPD73919.1 GGDEF domain-containing protein [Oceanispirochaeta sp. M1]RDG30232.1 GGDEF domain-containing protein [Oceanispirochaeta sp. M1]
MKKAITTVHTIIVILGLLATAGWSGYYLYNQRQFNTENNASRLPALVQRVSGSLSNSETLYDKGFGEDIKQIFTENKDIIALSIYSYDTGIEYFYSRNGQVKIVSEESDALEQNPAYKGLSFSNSIGSVPLQIKNKPGSNIDIIFTVLPRTSVFYVLKIALLAVIVLFVITLILIVAFSLSKEKAPKGKTEEDWNEESDTASDFSDALAEDMSGSSLDSGLGEDSFGDDSFGNDSLSDDSFGSDDSSDFSMDDDLDFDIPSDEPVPASDSDFSMDDDDLSLDSDLDDMNLDDMNLEDSIPDIPDEEDLLGMDHEELPSDDFVDSAAADDSADDFEFPADDSLFDEMSSDDLDIDDSHLDDVEPAAGDGSPTLYNPETGLGWEAFLDERLGLELERSASFDQDLVLLMIRDMGNENEMEQISAAVRDEYSYHDLIFEAGENSLALIEPNKDLDDAISDAQSLIKKLEQESGFSNLKCGLSSRNGRLITGKRLIKEADTSLNKADEENPIVGFRSDPEKFREYLSNKS